MSIGNQIGLDELFAYKNQLIGDIWTNKTIVDLITEDEHLRKHPEELVYKQVFPWEKVPGTTEVATTYVCIEVDVKNVLDKTYLEPIIYVWIFTHESLYRLPNGGGVRYDKIASEIVKILNGSRMYGIGELNLSSVRKLSPIDHYQGRTLSFITKEYNRIGQSGKAVPANRRS